MPVAGHEKNWEALLGMEQSLEDSRFATEEADRSSIVNGHFSSAEASTLARTSLDFLAGLAIPTVFRYAFPPVLLAVWQLLTQSVALVKEYTQIAIGIPRGHGKTTVIKLFVLFIILFTNRRFILIISATATLAENIVADITDMLNESNIIKLFGDWKLGSELDRQDLKKFGFRDRNIIIAAIGAGGSLRGLNIKNERPDVMIFEDVQTKECAMSKVQSDALENWVVGTAMKAKSPHGCLTIFVANMYPGPNSILKKLKHNPMWIKFVSGAILSDGTALWEELRSVDSLISELDNDMAMGHPEIFFSEVMNDTDVGINTKTDLALIRDWPWNQGEIPQGKFIIVDPSQNKKGGDLVTIARFDVFDATPGCVELVEEALSPGDTIKRALSMAIRHNITVIGIETTAFQFTLLYWFDFICKQLNITGIQAVEVYTGSASKNARITDMLKGLTSGEIIIHPSVKNLVIHQIANWNPLKRDNVDGILDTLSYAPKMIELYAPIIASDTSLEVIEASGARVQEHTHMF